MQQIERRKKHIDFIIVYCARKLGMDGRECKACVILFNAFFSYPMKKNFPKKCHSHIYRADSNSNRATSWHCSQFSINICTCISMHMNLLAMFSCCQPMDFIASTQ